MIRPSNRLCKTDRMCVTEEALDPDLPAHHSLSDNRSIRQSESEWQALVKAQYPFKIIADTYSFLMV